MLTQTGVVCVFKTDKVQEDGKMEMSLEALLAAKDIQAGLQRVLHLCKNIFYPCKEKGGASTNQKTPRQPQ